MMLMRRQLPDGTVVELHRYIYNWRLIHARNSETLLSSQVIVEY